MQRIESLGRRYTPTNAEMSMGILFDLSSRSERNRGGGEDDLSFHVFDFELGFPVLTLMEW